MNGRTAYKLLRKARRSNFGGKRCLVAVKLPLSLANEPPPESEIKESWVTIKLSNGNYKIISINKVNGLKEDPEDYPYTKYLEKPDPYCPDRVEWWDGWYLITTKDLSDNSYNRDTDIVEQGELDQKTVTDYVKYQEWEKKYIHGDYYWQPNVDIVINPVLNAFHQAATWAKTTYGGVEGDKIYIVYSIKCNYIKKFAPLLSKAMKIAKNNNIKVRAFPVYNV